MSNYPTLTSMGVQNPLHIIGYSLSQPRPDSDVLRIKYARPKGSFLPITRSYTFGRMSKVQIANGATGQVEQIFEISPTLSNAVSELDSIVNIKHNQQELKQLLLSELERVQHEFNAEISSLRQLIEKLE